MGILLLATPGGDEGDDYTSNREFDYRGWRDAARWLETIDCDGRFADLAGWYRDAAERVLR
jgi:hypothetical protein